MKTNELFDKLPTVSEILETPRLKRLIERANQITVVNSVRTVLDDVRSEYQRAKSKNKAPTMSELAERIARRVLLGEDSHARPVINASGNLLHCRLGAPPLAEPVLDNLVMLARDYASLDLDPLTGQVAPRDEAATELLSELTKAESALVVNNFAGSLLLTTGALAGGKEILIARGHLIETGSGQRLADLLTAGGSKLKEVGAVNRVDLEDYQSAITPETGAIFYVGSDPSAKEPEAEASEEEALTASDNAPHVALSELVALARRHDLPVVQVIDCATLLAKDKLNLPGCVSLPNCVKQGASVIVTRGDGLIGGPESGLLLGDNATLNRLRKHPLHAALQTDKLTLVALAATLQWYRDPAEALLHIPILQLANAAIENLQQRAERIAPQLAAIEGIESAKVVKVSHAGESKYFELPTWCVELQVADGGAERILKALRMGQPAVLATEKEGRIVLDLRGVLARQDIDLISAVETVCGS